jgi:hypothetical protein
MYLSSRPISAAAAAANATRASILRRAHKLAAQLPRRGKFAGRYATRFRRGLFQAWAIHQEALSVPRVVPKPVTQLLKTIAAIAPYVSKKPNKFELINELYFGDVKADQVLRIIRAAWELNEQVPYLYPERKNGASFDIDIKGVDSYDSFYLHFSRVAGYTAQSHEEINAFETERQELCLPHREESYPIFEALLPLARREKLITLAGVLSSP